MWHELRLFLTALQVLTRVPLARRAGRPPQEVNDSARHFPAVGLVVGGSGAAVLWAAAHAWPAMVAVLLSMAAMAWLTRALHEGALAAACDGEDPAGSTTAGLGPGSHGAIALVLVLGLKAAALHGLVTRDLWATLAVLPLAHAWSRTAIVALVRALPLAADGAAARTTPPLREVDGLGLAVALLWSVLAAASASLFLPDRALLAAAVAALLATAWGGRRLQRHRRGGSAALLGATQQVAELAIYLATLAALAHD